METTETLPAIGEGATEGYYTEEADYIDEGDYAEESYFSDESENTGENEYTNEVTGYTEGDGNTSDSIEYTEEGDHMSEGENNTTEVEDIASKIKDTTEGEDINEVEDNASEVEDTSESNDTRDSNATREDEGKSVRTTPLPAAEEEGKDASKSMTSSPEAEDSSSSMFSSPEAEEDIKPQDAALPSQPEPEPFPVDFSTNESSVRTFVFQGDVEAAVETMITSDAESIGAGLTFDEEFVSLVEPSSNRDSDPDVVAFKALALAAVDTGNASRFATAVVLSYDQDDSTGIFTSQELDELLLSFTADFSNTTELQEIVSANANLSLIRRRLQGARKSPVNSFVCSFCWPKKQCKKLYWC